MKPILVSSGEPAGIGPDICLDLANTHLPLVILGDPEILKQRAALLKKDIRIDLYEPAGDVSFIPNRLWVYPVPCPVAIVPGKLSVDAASYVLNLLTLAAQLCLSGQAAALVTAPVHKAIINQAGIAFSGHTEFFAELSQRSTVVMLLVSEKLRVSLLTTHLPLHQIASHITAEGLTQHVEILHRTLQKQFGLLHPRIKIAGLNPHAGEGGYLGMEEIEIITPVIQTLQKKGLAISGPYSADTMFLDNEDCDVFVAMYHDQGLPVIKYASFGHAVNVTCGLPFIRTSVDHGTALSLAATGRAQPDSLLAAVHLAEKMAKVSE